MSNFTKSILYSTTVLAAGLVAIFAIYNNVTSNQDGASVANLAPAAGESELGINFGEAQEQVQAIEEQATEAAQKAVDELNALATAAGEKAEEAVEAVEAAIEEAPVAAEEIEPAAAEAADEAEKAVEDAAAAPEQAPAEDAAH